MPGLAQVAGVYSLQLVGVDAPSLFAVTTVGVAWIALMTLICYLGIELSAHTQKLLLASEVVILAIFAVAALVRVYDGDVPGARVAANWFNPFAVDGGAAFTQAMLAAVFIYWGWDTATTVNEETQNSATAPARSAIVSTLLLVALYVIVAVAAVAFAEPDLAAYVGDDFLAPLAASVLGPGIGKLLVFAVLTSAAACTQTTILPAARTVISMARVGALPRKFGDIHPHYLTPGFATLLMGAISVVWYVGLVLLSGKDVLTDSVTATAIGIAFYYGVTGFACVVYFRHQLFASAKNFILMGLVPALGGMSMLMLFVASVINYMNPEQNKTSFYGIGAALIFGVGSLVLGFLLMLIARIWLPDFFTRKNAMLPADSGRTSGS
jgi:amino acid transporter